MTAKKRNRKKPKCSQKSFSCGFSCQPRMRNGKQVTCRSNVDELGNKLVETYADSINRLNRAKIGGGADTEPKDFTLEDLERDEVELKQSLMRIGRAMGQSVEDVEKQWEEINATTDEEAFASVEKEFLASLEQGNDDILTEDENGLLIPNPTALRRIRDKGKSRVKKLKEDTERLEAKIDDLDKELKETAEMLGNPPELSGIVDPDEVAIKEASPEQIQSFRNGLEDLIKPLLPDDVVQDLEESGAQATVDPSRARSTSKEEIDKFRKDIENLITPLLPQDVIDALNKKDDELSAEDDF